MEERLQKVMAAAGIASRRASEQLILAGRVTVNGQTVTQLGTKVDPERDAVAVDGQPLQVKASRVYIKLNKPAGVLSTVSDSRGRPTIIDLVGVADRVYPVGRLDEDSEGLILLTSDGELTQRLTHPRYGCEKVYLVLVQGRPTDEALERLVKGVELEEGMARARAVRRVAGILRDAPLIELKSSLRTSWLEITMTEGHKRQIRRMFDALGHRVERLIRIRLGSLTLGNLKPGEWKPLSGAEVRALLHKSGKSRASAPRRPAPSPAPRRSDQRSQSHVRRKGSRERR